MCNGILSSVCYLSVCRGGGGGGPPPRYDAPRRDGPGGA